MSAWGVLLAVSMAQTAPAEGEVPAAAPEAQPAPEAGPAPAESAPAESEPAESEPPATSAPEVVADPAPGAAPESGVEGVEEPAGVDAPAGGDVGPSQPRSAADSQAPPAAGVEDDDEIIIIDAEPTSGSEGASTGGEGDDDGDDDDDDEIIIIDDGEGEGEGEVTAPPTPIPFIGGNARMTFGITSRLMLDTKFTNATGEDILEWWNTGRLTLNYSRGTLRAHADAWVRWGVAGEDPRPEHSFALFNVDETKWTGEVELREGFVEYGISGFKFTVGQRIYVWGKNELFAPADVMNPLDIRYDPLSVLDSTKDGKVPVFTLQADYFSGDSGLLLVLQPFFTAHKALLFGRDFALVTPGSELENQIRAVATVHPSIEDQIQQPVNATELPEESPENTSIALRGLANWGGWDFGATVYFGWDRIPKLRVDPDLFVVAERNQEILANPSIVFTDPDLRDVTLRLQQKVAVGDALVEARYERMWLFALEAEGVVGDFVLRADVGFRPDQRWYGQTLESHQKPTLQAVAGAEYNYNQELFIQLTFLNISVFDAPEADVLSGIEPPDIDPADRDVAAMYALAGTLRYLWEEQNVEVQVGGVWTIKPGDYSIFGQIAYRDLEPHEISFGAFIIGDTGGDTIGERFDRNDFLYLQYSSTW